LLKHLGTLRHWLLGCLNRLIQAAELPIRNGYCDGRMTFASRAVMKRSFAQGRLEDVTVVLVQSD